MFKIFFIILSLPSQFFLRALPILVVYDVCLACLSHCFLFVWFSYATTFPIHIWFIAFYTFSSVYTLVFFVFCVHIFSSINPYPTAFPYGNGMVLYFYQQQESSTTKTVHKVINKGLKAYV